MSAVSHTDMDVFSGLANPQKTNLDQLDTDYRNGLLDRRQASTPIHESDEDSEKQGSEKQGIPPLITNFGSQANSQVESRGGDCSHIDSHANSREASRVNSRQESLKRSPHDSPVQSIADHNSTRNRSRSSSDSDDDPPAPPRSVGSENEQPDPIDLMSPHAFTSMRTRRESSPPVSEVNSRVSDRRSTVSDARSSTMPIQTPFAQFVNANSASAGSVSQAHGMPDVFYAEKQNVLMDIERLKLQGITFSKNWTIDDRLEDMQYEVRRHMLHIEECNNMNMMRDGMRMICTGIEMVNGRMHLLELNGWASEVCADMSKYDPALSKLYRKYWRRTQSSSPEMEVAMGVLTSMGMYHFKKKLSSRMFTPRTPSMPAARHRAPSPAASETDSEAMPP